MKNGLIFLVFSVFSFSLFASQQVFDEMISAMESNRIELSKYKKNGSCFYQGKIHRLNQIFESEIANSVQLENKVIRSFEKYLKRSSGVEKFCSANDAGVLIGRMRYIQSLKMQEKSQKRFYHFQSFAENTFDEEFKSLSFSDSLVYLNNAIAQLPTFNVSGDQSPPVRWKPEVCKRIGEIDSQMLLLKQMTSDLPGLTQVNIALNELKYEICFGNRYLEKYRVELGRLKSGLVLLNSI